jgi:acyl carrier protein
MNETAIRELIAEALTSANVIAFRQNDLRLAFLQGQRDVSLAELDIDSLAAMELCIALEINIGTSIVPDQLQTIGSLDRLVATVMEMHD